MKHTTNGNLYIAILCTLLIAVLTVSLLSCAGSSVKDTEAVTDGEKERPERTKIIIDNSRESTAPDEPASTAHAEEAWTLSVNGITLHGTFCFPADTGKQTVGKPAVLIISGSGPTDRDGNTALMPGKNNSLKMLAVGLAENGISSLRYDKRGVGKSRIPDVNEADHVFDDLIEDAVHWAEKLKEDPRTGEIIVLGHSEGSLIGMIAAKRTDAAAYIGIAAPGRPIDDVLEIQLSNLPPALKTESDRILRLLRRGETTEDVPEALLSVYRPGVQPYLISFMRYDPAEELAGLNIPVLLIQGGKDLQVFEQDFTILQSAQPHAVSMFYPDMNHVLKQIQGGQEENISSYTDPSFQFPEGLVEEISDFIFAVLRL